MDRAQLLHHFDTLAETPEVVAKLRSLIIQLGITGRLVPHDEADKTWQTAILQDRKSVIQALRLTRHPESNPLADDESPPSLPSSWLRVRLGDLTYGCPTAYGDNPSPDQPSAGVITVGNIDNTGGFKGRFSERSFPPDEIDDLLAHKGDLIVVKSSGSAENVHSGKAALCTDEHHKKIVGSNFVMRLRPFGKIVLPEFLWLVLISRTSRAWIERTVQTMTYPNLKWSEYAQLPVAIPSPAEQRRIVAKVEELLTLCDALEGAQSAAREHRTRLVRSALDHLTTALDDSDFKKHSAFCLQHSELLFDSVPALRQTILSLAVQGHLVARIKEDGTAEKLLKEVGAEAVTPEDAPFLPAHWNWAGLGDLVTKMDSGWSPACPAEPASENAWGVLRTTAVQTLRYLEYENKALPENLEPRPEHEVMKGDILITRAGPKNRVGISCVVEATRPRLMISDKIVRFHLHPLIDPRFGALCLNAGYTSVVLERLKSGMAESQMNISQGKFKTTPLPIPPLAEQQRIVAKVDELLRWCDALEARLTIAQTTATHLLDATLRQILAA